MTMGRPRCRDCVSYEIYLRNFHALTQEEEMVASIAKTFPCKIDSAFLIDPW